MKKLSWLAVAALLVATCGGQVADTSTSTLPGGTLPGEVPSAQVTTSSISPTTAAPLVTTTTHHDVAVTDIDSGLFCRDLAATPYDYADAVTYFMAEGRPDRMDADLNGIPCETVWPRHIVEGFWGDLMPDSTEITVPEVIDQIESGLFCRDLAEQGSPYPEAVAYWMHEVQPERMDADKNGIPCETVYHASDVQEVYGSDAALDFYLVASFAGEARFEISGAAVDAGLVCPAGTIGWPEVSGYSWADEYTCDDGTGTFIAGVHIYFLGEHEYSAWEIVSGTGNYVNLTGGGGCDTGVFPGLPEGVWQDHLHGRVELSP